MADTRTQSEREQREQRGERGIQRREEFFPSRDIFGFSPFSMMRRLSEDMDRALASTLGLGRTAGGAGWMPAVEVREHDNNLEVTAELPGLTKDDVKVQCTDEGLIIEGEKRREKEATEGGFHRSERIYGHFYRVIPLPEGADPDKAKAEFKDGVLRVQVPLSEQRHKSKQIPIGT